MLRITGAALVIVASAATALAAGPDGDPGLALLSTACGACHAVSTEDASAHPQAPAFRTLGQSYPVGQLREALAEGIVSGHPDMPEQAFSPDEIEAMIAWLERIQTQ